MTEVKFGWHMPSFPIDGTQGTAFPQQIIDCLTLIEESYDSIWADDHVHPWADFQPSETDALECLTTLTYLAGQFPNIDVGSMVLCQSFRNPALLAKMVANIQLLTGGRFIFGIGAGWFEEEYRAYNYEYPSAGVRLAQLEEAVQIAKKLWTESPASFEGKHYRIENAYCEPKPDPIPPIMIGGGGEKVTLRLVAHYADRWNLPGEDVATYSHKLNVLKTHCDTVGRDYETIMKTWSPDVLAIATSEAEAHRIAEQSPYSGTNPLIGTPNQIVDQLGPYIDLGVEEFYLRFVDFPSSAGLELFAKTVIPQING